MLYVAAERSRECWQVGLNHIANRCDVDTKVVVYEYVAKTANLWPGDFRVGNGDLRREMLRSFPNDLQVSFDGIFRHVDQVCVTTFERV